MTRNAPTFLALAALPALLLAHGGVDHGAGKSHSKPETPSGRHGGQVLASGDRTFEVIFEDSGIHVFPMDASGTPLTPRHLTGEVVLRARRGKPQTIPLEPIKDELGRVVHLMARRDFSGVRDGTRKATFQLEGAGDSKSEFWAVLRRTPGAKMAGSHSAHAAGFDHSMGGSPSSHGPEALKAARGAAALAAQVKAYPIDWCLVSGDKLGSDGPPVDVLHEGRLVRFCCESCVKSFKENPSKYLADLDAASRGKSVQRPAGSGSSHEGGSHGSHGHDHGGHSH